MKKFFFVAALLFSVQSFASTVQTTFNADVKFHRADGKVKKLAKIRVITQHNSEASVLRPSTLEDCQIAAGKKDLLSLFTEADVYTCLATKNTLMMSSQTLQSIVDRSIALTIFGSEDLFGTLDNIIRTGKVVSNAPGGALNSVISRLGRDVLRSDSIELMRLDGGTSFKISDDRGLESFEVNLSIKNVEYLN